MDDTFCLFNNDNDASHFYDFINSQHTDIKFTMEKEENLKLPFLDVLVDNSHPDVLVTSQGAAHYFFFSFTPLSYKIGLIRTLVDKGFHIDIQQLTSILMINCFTCNIAQRVLNQYLYKVHTISVDTSRQDHSEGRTKRFFKLPYIGPFSLLAQRILNQNYRQEI